MNYKNLIILTITLMLFSIFSFSIYADHHPGHFDTSRPINTEKVDTSKSKTRSENPMVDTIGISACNKIGCYDSDITTIAPAYVNGFVYVKDWSTKKCKKYPDKCKKIGEKHYVEEKSCNKLTASSAVDNLFGLGSDLIACEGNCKNNACQKPTCSDGFKNQGEAGVDCGGPCNACGITPESECIKLGCYDTDGGVNLKVFGKVLLKKKKSNGKEYCIPSEDTCKSTIENGIKTWHVIEQTCKKDEQTGLLFSEPKFEKCEGICDKGACLPPTCTDGYQNQGELGVDCGGPCSPCVTEYCEDQFGDTPNTKDYVSTKYVNGGLFEVKDTCVDNTGKEVENIVIDYQIIKLHEKICVDNTVQNKEYDCGAYGNNDVCVDGKCIDLSCESTDAQTTEGFIQKSTSILKADGVVVSDHPDFCSNSYVEPLASTNEGQYLVESVCVFDHDNPYLPPTTCPLSCKEGECISCIDPDGNNLFTQTTTQGYPNSQSITLDSKVNPKTVAGIKSETDSCLIQTYGNTPEDPKVESCKGKDCYIKEYVCNTYLTYDYKPCPQGCKEGACIDCDYITGDEIAQYLSTTLWLDEQKATNLAEGKIVLGDPNAPYTLIMLNAYGSQYAKKWYKETFPLIKHYYIDTGKIKFQIREIDPDGWKGLNPNIEQTDRATFCAEEQGKYWEFIDMLFMLDNFDTDSLLETAEVFNSIDFEKFKTCLDSLEAQAKLNKDIEITNLFDIQGVPWFVLQDFEGGEGLIIPGALDYPAFDKSILYFVGGCYEAKACYDSDKGIDLYGDSEFGETYESGFTAGYQDDGVFINNLDICLSAAQVFGSEYDFANDPEIESDDVGVLEGTCGNKQQDITVTSDNEFDDYVITPSQAQWHKCKYGCEDGKCLEEKQGITLDNCRYIKYGFDNQGNAIKGSDYLLCDIHNNGDQSYNFQELGSYIEANGYHWGYVVNTEVPVMFNPGGSFTFVKQGTIDAPVLNEEHCNGKDINFGIFIKKGLEEDFIFQEDVPVTCYDYNQCPTVYQSWGNLVHKQSTLISSKTGEQQTDTCAGEVLSEYICDVNQISSNLFKCPYGCDNGICLKEEMQCDASQLKWEKMFTGTTDSLYSIWGSSKDNIYAVGDRVILYYDGNSWTKISNELVDNLEEVTLSDIWGSSSTDVFVVGEDGLILHYNGISWNKMESGVPDSLYAIFGFSNNDIYVVGQKVILHYDGVTWTKIWSDVIDNLGDLSLTLYDVWGSSSNDIYIIGDQELDLEGNGESVIIHYDGVTWNKIGSGVSSSLYALWGSSKNNVYAVGNDGVILHYNDAMWTEMESGVTSQLSAIWGNSDNNIYAAGWDGIILNYNGEKWNKMENKISGYFSDIWGSSDTEIYSVGWTGVIVHSTCSPIEPTNNMCKESEYGIDYFVKDYIELQEGATKKSPADFCSATNEEFDFEELEQSMYLREAFCNGPTSDFYPINCPCTNGACGCLDTEDSIYEASTAKGYEVFDETTKNNPQSFIEAPDFCTAYTKLEDVKNNPMQEGNYVVEASCKDNVLVGYYNEPVKCPEGYHCQSGACVSDDACIKLTDYKKGIPKESDYQQTISISKDTFSKDNGQLVFDYPDSSFTKPITYLKILPQFSSLYHYRLMFSEPIDYDLSKFSKEHFINFQGYEAEILDALHTPYFRLKLLFSKATKLFKYPEEQFTFSLGDETCHTLQYLDKNIIYNSYNIMDTTKSLCTFKLDETTFSMHADELKEVDNILFYLNLSYETMNDEKTYLCKLSIEPRIVEFYKHQSYQQSTISVNKVVIADLKPTVYVDNLYPPRLLGFGYNFTPSKPKYLSEGDGIVDPLLVTFRMSFSQLYDGIAYDENQKNYEVKEGYSREEINFIAGPTTAEIIFTNNDNSKVILPLAGVPDCKDCTPAKKPVYFGVKAPTVVNLNQNNLVYLEGETCKGNTLKDCEGAMILVVDGNKQAHLMQITNIDLQTNKITFNDKTVPDQFYLDSYQGYSISQTKENGWTVTLNIQGSNIKFEDIGSSDGASMETLNKGRLIIHNQDKNSQIFEGFSFEEYNDGSIPYYKHFESNDFKIEAVYNEVKQIIQFNIPYDYISNKNKPYYPSFGFGWYPVSKNNNEFEVFMTYKGTKLVYDVADNKSLLIDHPSKAVLAKLYLISKPDNYAAFGLGNGNIPTHGLHYNQTINQFENTPFTKEYLPVLLADGEMK